MLSGAPTARAALSLAELEIVTVRLHFGRNVVSPQHGWPEGFFAGCIARCAQADNRLQFG